MLMVRLLQEYVRPAHLVLVGEYAKYALEQVYKVGENTWDYNLACAVMVLAFAKVVEEKDFLL